jgi:hypothetical protein
MVRWFWLLVSGGGGLIVGTVLGSQFPTSGAAKAKVEHDMKKLAALEAAKAAAKAA